MKKIISIVVIVCVLLTGTMTSFAHYVNRPDLGISFSLSDNWNEYYIEDAIGYCHYLTDQECVVLEVIGADWAWSMELVTAEELLNLCNEMYSNSKLADVLSEQNGVHVTVTTDSIIHNYEYYNNVQYFRYEKAYTAHAYGYNDTPFYDTVFVTVKNGRVYFIEYQRDSEYNHFNDVSAMLDSISFESGEIKIEINGNRIYPDSAPMLIEDRTLVPIRAVAEAMGYFVGWDDENQIVTLEEKSGESILHFVIGSDIALKNYSQEIALDVPAIIVGGRTYLPLRAVAEAMDAKVNWNDPEQTVEINY